MHMYDEGFVKDCWYYGDDHIYHIILIEVLFLQVSVAPGGRWNRFKTYSTIQRTCEIWGFVITFLFKAWFNNQKFAYRGQLPIQLLIYVHVAGYTFSSYYRYCNFYQFFLLKSLAVCRGYDGAEKSSKEKNVSQVVKGEYIEIRAHIHQNRSAVLNKSRHSCPRIC